MHNIRNEPRFHAFELLASLVSVVDVQGRVQFSNAVFEDAVGLSRRMITGTLLADYFLNPSHLSQLCKACRKIRSRCSVMTLRCAAVAKTPCWCM